VPSLKTSTAVAWTITMINAYNRLEVLIELLAYSFPPRSPDRPSGSAKTSRLCQGCGLTCGEAAGTQPGSSSAERMTVNVVRVEVRDLRLRPVAAGRWTQGSLIRAVPGTAGAAHAFRAAPRGCGTRCSGRCCRPSP
jgi:hypothetical protein